jgi:hypothetical protein
VSGSYYYSCAHPDINQSKQPGLHDPPVPTDVDRAHLQRGLLLDVAGELRL